MEVKAILEKIRQQKEEEKEYFYALQLEEGLVKSALWTVENSTVRVLAFGEGQPWEKEEELLEAVDSSLPFYEGAEPQRVIFGVSSDWVSENKIVPEKLQLFKKISKELELTPLGFVVTSEAIIHHLKITEGIPLTAILAILENEKLIVTLVKLGRTVGNQTVRRSEDLGADLGEGLSRFGAEETFPPRIILCNKSEKLEEEKQQLINFSWDKLGINFLHLPRVEILPADFNIRAIALAGGREVTKSEAIKISPLKIKQIPSEEIMGFVKGKDITTKIPYPERSRGVPPKPTPPSLTPIFSLFSQVPSKAKKIFEKIFDFLKGFFSGRATLVGGLVAGFFLVLGGVLITCWWYFPKAEVILIIKPQIAQKDFTVRLDPKLSAVDKTKLALPAQEVETTLEDEKTTQTTGTKLVGEPAKGEVAIYNRTSSQKSFKAGTEIIGPNNLKFTLNEEVIVASESAGSDYTKIPGKGSGKITATAIGSEGNLAAGAEFTVGNFSKSDYVAKNDSAFSGGTSREVQVVAKKDQEKLLLELTDELKNKALGELKSKISPGRQLVEESNTSKIVSKNFDKNIDEEANEVLLKLKLKFTALSFDPPEFRNLVEDEIKKTIPEGFEYKPEETETEFELKEFTKDGVAIFSARFKANLFPMLDLEAIKKNLLGKHPGIGKAYLGTLPAVDSFEVRITPRLPDKLATFPKVGKNIKIEVRKR